MIPKQLVTRGYSGHDGGVDNPNDATHDKFAVALNGQNEYVAICNTDVKQQLMNASNSRQITWLVWFKAAPGSDSNHSSDEQTILQIGTVGANYQLWVYLKDGDQQIYYKWGSSSSVTEQATGLSITDNKWHFLDFRLIDERINVILDGDFAGRKETVHSGLNVNGPANGITYIGANMQDGTAAKFFKGRIASVIILKIGYINNNIFASIFYNDGNLVDPSEWNSSLVWLEFGNAYQNAHWDGDDNLVFHNKLDSIQTDLLENNGFAPGTSIANWTTTGNFTATDTYATSAASGTSSSTLVYDTTGDFELTALWLYLLVVVSSSTTDAGGDVSTITFGGNTAKSAAGWSLETIDNYFIATNTNNLTFTSFADSDSSAAMEVREVFLYKPQSIAYGVGMSGTRGSDNIVVDGPQL
tara:strand:+ start:400 stop:1641 length:1242 start_codon:yes stop_codon:yes gene_type:complete